MTAIGNVDQNKAFVLTVVNLGGFDYADKASDALALLVQMTDSVKHVAAHLLLQMIQSLTQ